ncbi:hypothetical protein CEXT_551781, partial [Caerostris extrusa]
FATDFRIMQSCYRGLILYTHIRKVENNSSCRNFKDSCPTMAYLEKRLFR